MGFSGPPLPGVIRRGGIRIRGNLLLSTSTAAALFRSVPGERSPTAAASKPRNGSDEIVLPMSAPSQCGGKRISYDENMKMLALGLAASLMGVAAGPDTRS